MNSLDLDHAAELAGRIDRALAEKGAMSGILRHDDTLRWLMTSSREDVLFFLSAEHILDFAFPYLPTEPEQVEDGPDSPLLRLARARVQIARDGLEHVCVD